MSRSVLVSGATGKQGRALINALLEESNDFRILALTRNTSSDSAQRLAAKSAKITLLEGDLNDTTAIFEKALATESSVWGVFSVQALQTGSRGPAVEEKQGKSLIDDAIKFGVRHFVYTSADRGGEKSQDNPTKVPHFISKHNIEQHLIRRAAAANTDMTWTILRPVAFMDNFDGGFFGKVMATAWRDVVKTRPLQLVATEDIGVIASQAFTQPGAFAQRAISLAGDELSFSEMAKVYGDVMGDDQPSVPTTFSFVIRALFWFSDELGEMFKFFEKEGFGADLQDAKKLNPKTKDFRAWLQANGKPRSG